MDATAKNNDYADQAKRIRYSFINAITLFSTNDSVELIPIVDRLFLFFQENLGIEIQESDTGRSVFSFTKGFPVLLSKLTPNFFSSCVNQELNLTLSANNIKRYKIFLYNSDNIIEPKQLTNSQKEIFTIKLKALVNEINTENSDGLKSFLHEGLDNAFENKEQQSNGSSLIDVNNFKIEEGDINNKYCEKCKNAIRGILDDVFESFKGNPIIFSRDWDMIKLFAVIRYPSSLRSIENYTEQILLSTRQKQSIEHKKSQLENKVSPDILERPLKENETSLADICFKLDTVQFGLGYDENNQRPEETILYKELNTSKPNSALFVPIHVNGCPWLALYRINSENANWWLNFEMYSQYTLLIAEKLRLKTKEVVHNLIDVFIEDAISDNKVADGSVSLNGFIDTFNIMMDYMSCYFPFPSIKLEKQSDEVAIFDFFNSLSDSGPQLTINSIWQQTVRYTKEEEGQFIKKVKLLFKINADFIKASNVNRELIAASYSISHLLKNKLDEPYNEVEGMVNNLDNLVDNYGLQLDKSEYRNRFAKFKMYHDDLRDILQILDLIPKSGVEITEPEDYRVFQTKKIYLEMGIIDMLQLINESANRKSVVIDLSKIKKCAVNPFIKNSDDILCTPAKFIYHNCLVEIMINYNNINPTGNLILTKCVDTNGNVGIGFRNKTSNDKTLYEFVNVGPQDGFHGAIGYLRTIFNKVNIGNIKSRVFEDNGDKYFELGLFLKHLEVVEHE